MLTPNFSNFLQPVVTAVFYLLILVIAVYSLVAIYALLKFGQDKKLGLLISAVYLLIAGGLFFTAQFYLNKL